MFVQRFYKDVDILMTYSRYLPGGESKNGVDLQLIF